MHFYNYKIRLHFTESIKKPAHCFQIIVLDAEEIIPLGFSERAPGIKCSKHLYTDCSNRRLLGRAPLLWSNLSRWNWLCQSKGLILPTTHCTNNLIYSSFARMDWQTTISKPSRCSETTTSQTMILLLSNSWNRITSQAMISRLSNCWNRIMSQTRIWHLSSSWERITLQTLIFLRSR